MAKIESTGLYISHSNMQLTRFLPLYVFASRAIIRVFVVHPELLPGMTCNTTRAVLVSVSCSPGQPSTPAIVSCKQEGQLLCIIDR